jgi:phosphoserine aminotransferase
MELENMLMKAKQEEVLNWHSSQSLGEMSHSNKQVKRVIYTKQ